MINRTALAISAAATAFTLVFAALLIYAVPAMAESLAATAAASERQGVPQRAVPDANTTGSTARTADQAAAIALQAFPRGRLLRAPEPVTYQGVAAYEIRLNLGVVYVDEASGRIISQGVRTARSAHEESENRESDEHHGTLFGFRGERHED